MQWMKECVRQCCKFALPLGVDILWEPINRYEMDDFNTVEQALAFLDEIQMPNLRLMIDTFHMNIEESSILDSIHAAADHTSYIQLADSNRRAPGFGHLDFDAIGATLANLGYDGVLSAEILPLPDPITAGKQAIKVFNQFNELIRSAQIKEK
jgi:5-keto-L-gluconate epimerase